MSDVEDRLQALARTARTSPSTLPTASVLRRRGTLRRRRRGVARLAAVAAVVAGGAVLVPSLLPDPGEERAVVVAAAPEGVPLERVVGIRQLLLQAAPGGADQRLLALSDGAVTVTSSRQDAVLVALLPVPAEDAAYRLQVVDGSVEGACLAPEDSVLVARACDVSAGDQTFEVREQGDGVLVTAGRDGLRVEAAGDGRGADVVWGPEPWTPLSAVDAGRYVDPVG